MLNRILTPIGLTAALLFFVVLLALAIQLQRSERLMQSKRDDIAEKIMALERQSFERGFIAGMNATLKHVPLATNTVDIAPILQEMK